MGLWPKILNMQYKVNFELELKKNPYEGLYIALEGIDGSGKTTQAKWITEELQKNGYKAVYTKEPTDGEVGRFIRGILAGEKKFEPFAFQYLFMADRVEHQKMITKSLGKNIIVVSDRCYWSSVAYGGTDRGIDFGKDEDADLLLSVYGILSPYHQFMAPDLTIYLDVSPKSALERLSSVRHNADIYDKLEKLEKITTGYRWLMRKFKEEFTVIDGDKPLEEVSRDLFEKVQKLLR